MSLAVALMLSCAVMAVVLFGGFLLLRPPKCPRCGSREWAPLPHKGRYHAYCKGCTLEVDMANWRKE
jgi:hypothetical protein